MTTQELLLEAAELHQKIAECCNDRAHNDDAAHHFERAAMYKAAAEKMGEAVAWVDVPGFEDLYEVSSAGHVKNKQTGRTLSNKALAGKGYVKCDLWRNNVRTQSYLHRIVCEAFHGPSGGREVNHIDGDKLNNRPSNLEWVSKSENILHSYYVLGNIVNPVCSRKKCGEVTLFRSVEEAVAAGHQSSHIYSCLRGDRNTHCGMEWFRPKELAPPPAVPEGWTLEEARLRSAVVAGIRATTGCPDFIGIGGVRLVDAVIAEAKSMLAAAKEQEYDDDDDEDSSEDAERRCPYCGSDGCDCDLL